MNDTEEIKDVLEHFKNELKTTQMLLKTVDKRSKMYKTLCKIEHTDKIVIMALEKQIPKKLKREFITIDGYKTDFKGEYCPNCNKMIEVVYNCCYNCGQNLDWSDDNA